MTPAVTAIATPSIIIFEPFCMRRLAAVMIEISDRAAINDAGAITQGMSCAKFTSDSILISPLAPLTNFSKDYLYRHQQLYVNKKNPLLNATSLGFTTPIGVDSNPNFVTQDRKIRNPIRALLYFFPNHFFIKCARKAAGYGKTTHKTRARDGLVRKRPTNPGISAQFPEVCNHQKRNCKEPTILVEISAKKPQTEI